MKKKPTIYEEADKQFQAAQSRTNIIMEEPLVAEAQAITGIKTKTGVVHHALRELVRRQKMKEVLEMRGKVEFWDGYEAAHVNP
jgi:Arc/MetJ family transcription regulator